MQVKCRGVPLGKNHIKFDLGWTEKAKAYLPPFKSFVARPYNQQQFDILVLLGGHSNELGAAVRLSCGRSKDGCELKTFL